ncbi:MAG: NADH-quinone oxidoreductase subunit [Frankiaceae bacterium]|jgi:NADH-quinone oxidoreductase subunit C|nr:NADH-quinone oxidoreductase subunit [Frankiaceae bacterium]
MTPEDLAAHLAVRIEGAVPTIAYGELTLDVPLSSWVPAATAAATDPAVACDYFDWLGAVDGGQEIAVVTHLYSPALRHHVRIRTRVGPADAVPSLRAVFRGADWHERETHEMFGVRFTGGADPAPLLLPPGFEGSPLRKDFVLASRVATAWPGLVEPGEAPGERRPTLPPGVPEPGTWPATADGGEPGD